MKALSVLMLGLTLLVTQTSVAFAQGATISGVVVAGGAVVKLTDEPPSLAPPGFQSQYRPPRMSPAGAAATVEPTVLPPAQ
jgi:hypothetical protein